MNYVIEALAVRNEASYNEDKLLEELAELSEAVLKRRTKGNTSSAPTLQDLIDEMGDVYMRLDIYKKMLGLEVEVDIRIGLKLDKYSEYINNEKYKNI